MLSVLAPGKSSFYQEYFPGYPFTADSTKSSYCSLLKHIKEEGVRYIDFNKWFLSIKDTVSFPLFPKGGIHWSYYGMALCADSIIHYIAKDKNVKIPEVEWELEFPDSLRGSDNDLGKILNVWPTLSFQKMAYPKFKVLQDSTTKKLRILTIGDSFYWAIYDNSIFHQAFDNETYYYYCGYIYPEATASSLVAMDLDLVNEVKKYDVILLMQSSISYNLPGVNFIQQFSETLKKHEDYKNAIREKINLSYFDLLKKGRFRSAQNLSKEAAVEFLTNNLSQERFAKIENTKIQMRKNETMMNQLKQKSDAEKISVEKIMQREAEKITDDEIEKIFN